MTDRALAFVEGWIEDNLRAEGYPPAGDTSQAAALAAQCLVAAKAADIPEAEITPGTFENLVDYMAGELEEANDAEVERLADKD
jgi:hypothetical protein